MTANDWIQIIMAFFGTLGFTMFFNVHGMRAVLNAAGAMIGWAFYLFVFNVTGSLFQAYLMAALLVTFGCEMLARLTKTPTTMMIVPMLFPAIPGGDLYNAAANLFQGNFELSASYGLRLAIEIGALNLGIVLATTLTKLYLYELRRFRMKRQQA